jgi:DNA sulfur modification protein DndC
MSEQFPILRETTLTGEKLRGRHQQIQDVYLADTRPWVIGYSGGKDSTTTLQLIWTALSQLPRTSLHKPVYVISSDTLVETPKIVDYITTSVARMNLAATAQGLPFSAHMVRPIVENTFWVNLIGRGYPAPSKRFRWCTDRLKIDPANRFIMEKVAEYGSVVVVLGVRKAESATRAQVMSLHRVSGSLLSRHSSLPAFVYTPIEDFTVDDVWTYLLQVPSPWGNNNRDLVTMYRNAQAGECPLVVDTTTPSCGNSRFGCWVCTVVTKDKSMEAMVESGEDWLEPLLEFRDLLASTQNPDVKPQVREHKRRNGRVSLKPDGTIIHGPYKPVVRKQLLRRLLEVQKQVRSTGPNPTETLITPDELYEIRRIWRSELQDWEDSVPQIYREVFGEELDWVVDEQPAFSRHEKALLDEICAKHDVPAGLVSKLIEIEREMHGMSRRASIHQRLAAAFDEDWRPEAEVREAHAQKVDA